MLRNKSVFSILAVLVMLSMLLAAGSSVAAGAPQITIVAFVGSANGSHVPDNVVAGDDDC